MILDIREDQSTISGYNFKDSDGDVVKMELLRDTGDFSRGKIVDFTWGGYDNFDTVELTKEELKDLGTLVERTIKLIEAQEEPL